MIFAAVAVVAAVAPVAATGGAASFAGSDGLIAWDRLVRPVRRAGVAIMVTCRAGQALPVVSLLD